MVLIDMQLNTSSEISSIDLVHRILHGKTWELQGITYGMYRASYEPLRSFGNGNATHSTRLPCELPTTGYKKQGIEQGFVMPLVHRMGR